MNKNIKPRNDKGQKRGYWEVNWDNGKLMFKCNFVNDKTYGYFESYNYDGKISRKCFYIK